MSTPSVSPLKRLWYQWKSLSLPWRRQRLCGYDLTGNTFWEFRDALNSNRFRRIAKYPRSIPYSDIAISPAWLQWLRHTRELPPSVQDQQYEVQRQAGMKELAAQADARWRSQESFADKPKRRTLGEGSGAETAPRDHGGYVGKTENDSIQGVTQDVKGVEDEAEELRAPAKEKASKGNPWDRQKRRNPGEEWQPEAWQPPPRRRG